MAVEELKKALILICDEYKEKSYNYTVDMLLDSLDEVETHLRKNDSLAQEYMYDALLEIAKDAGDIATLTWEGSPIEVQNSEEDNYEWCDNFCVHGFYSFEWKRTFFKLETIINPKVETFYDLINKIHPSFLKHIEISSNAKEVSEEDIKKICNEIFLSIQSYLSVYICQEKIIFGKAKNQNEEKKSCDVILVDTSFSAFWSNYFDDFNELKFFQIANFTDEIQKIKDMSITEMYDENPRFIINKIITRIYNNNSFEKFTNAQLNQIVDYIFNFEYSEKLIRMLLAFNFAYNKFKKVDEKNAFFDLTFIAVSLFKMVEVVFHSLISERWPYTKKIDIPANEKKGPTTVNLANPKINLGAMYKIFVTTDYSIATFIDSKRPLSSKLSNILDRLINCSRNGYLHKHILYQNGIKESIDDSLQALALLILVFGKDVE